MRAKLLITTAVAGLALAGVAAAATPTAYRTQVSALCRSYTPAVKKANAQMASAQKAKDQKAFGYALGTLLGLGLSEDGKVRATPVPATMTAQMAPILSLLKTIDGQAHLVVSKLSAGDGNAASSALNKIAALSPGLNKLYDGAGLRDCGSGQS